MKPNTNQDAILRTAEWVLPGHPDRLADAIADSIVYEARRRERRALVGVEVAVHRNVVFIDGRVACQGAEEIDFKALVRKVYTAAGYSSRFPPKPGGLRLRTDLCLGPLLPGEGEFRAVSDDQSIVTGYACSLPGTDGLPVEQALAYRLGRELFELRRDRPELGLGPDGKLIVFLEEDPEGRRFHLREVTISIQHAADWDSIAALREITNAMRQAAESFASGVPGFEQDPETEIIINPIGDFVEGGPFGDNGLSGKKLVVDFYGPRVPIGGGAIFGKDFWKADRAGAILARTLALHAVQRLGLLECRVTLGIRPGDSEFRLLHAEERNGQRLDIGALEGSVDLRLAAVEDSLSESLDFRVEAMLFPPTAPSILPKELPPAVRRETRRSGRAAICRSDGAGPDILNA